MTRNYDEAPKPPKRTPLEPYEWETEAEYLLRQETQRQLDKATQGRQGAEALVRGLRSNPRMVEEGRMFFDPHRVLVLPVLEHMESILGEYGGEFELDLDVRQVANAYRHAASPEERALALSVLVEQLDAMNQQFGNRFPYRSNPLEFLLEFIQHPEHFPDHYGMFLRLQPEGCWKSGVRFLSNQPLDRVAVAEDAALSFARSVTPYRAGDDEQLLAHSIAASVKQQLEEVGVIPRP